MQVMFWQLLMIVANFVSGSLVLMLIIPMTRSQQLFLNMNNSNAVRCNKLGIGANAVVDVLNVNYGSSNFCVLL